MEIGRIYYFLVGNRRGHGITAAIALISIIFQRWTVVLVTCYNLQDLCDVSAARLTIATIQRHADNAVKSYRLARLPAGDSYASTIKE